jgi:signal transduction histidine kinase
MSKTPPAHADRIGNILVATAVVAPLLLVLGMFAHARRTETLRQQTSDGALRDYAAIAAWQLSVTLDSAFHQAVMDKVGRPSMIAPARQSINGPHSHGSACSPAAPLRPASFCLEPASGTINWLTPKPNDVDERLIVEAVRAAIDGERNTENRDEPHRAVFLSIGGRARALELAISRTSDRATFGVISDTDAFIEEIRNVLARAELVPSSVVKPPYGPDKLYVAISHADGSKIFESSAAPELTLAASQAMKPIWGALTITVQVQPAMANALLLGRPIKLTPAFMLLVVVSALLAWAAMVQLKRSRELSRSRAQFLANVSHELRTPLAHISMFAETIALARERSPEERRHFASVMHREAQRLSALVDRVLSFTRGEAGQLSLRSEVRSLHHDIESTATLFDPIARTAGSAIDLVLDDSVRAAVDEGAMRQIMLNLFDNAVKYGPERQRIAVRLARVGNEAVITVDDDGPGVPVDQRSRVFEPFVRLEHTRKTSGTGIGLAVVRELVAAQRGRVWIDDAPSGGARVCVAFPISRAVSATSPETDGREHVVTPA